MADSALQPALNREKTAALRFANRVRKQRGLEPTKFLPKGVRQRSSSCPLARACESPGDKEVYVDDATVEWFGEVSWVEVQIPPLAAAFVRDFDNGLFPELEEANNG